MHDCDIWLNTLPMMLEKERKRTAKFLGNTSSFHRIEIGMMYLTEHARTQRAFHYRSFVRIWNKADRDELWKRLTTVIT
jgi:hypothetical protein